MSRGNKLRLIGGLLRVAPKLPWRVALFQARALAIALRLGDTFTLQSVARPEQVVTYARNVWHHPMTVLDSPMEFAVAMGVTGQPGDDVFCGLDATVTIVMPHTL